MNFFQPKGKPGTQSTRAIGRAQPSRAMDSRANGYARAQSQKLLSDAPTGSSSRRPLPSGSQNDYSYKKCYNYPSLQNDLKTKIESLCDDSSNSDLCDATFRIGRNAKQFHVVAALFAIHSTELNLMLQENEDQVIVIEDVTADCFEFLRQYFYCLNPVINVENVSYILYAARKLKISSLIEATQQFILAVKGVDDLLLILSLLHALTLRDMCNEVIMANKLNEDAAKVFHSRNLNLLPTELMIRLLQQATFQTVKLTEEAVFEKCVIWAKYHAGKHAQGGSDKEVPVIDDQGVGADESDDEKEVVVEKDPKNWKSVIQPLLPHVRFPNMQGNYFAANVVELKLLSADDCTYIMQCLLTGKESKSLKYSTKKRTHAAKRQYATSSNAQYANPNKK